VKKEKIVVCIHSSLTWKSLLYKHYFIFFFELYKYLLNIKFCMLIEDQVNYPLIFLIKILQTFKVFFNMGV
jgi:hypothetical protein